LILNKKYLIINNYLHIKKEQEMSSLTIYKDFNTETPRERKYNETNLISGDKEGLLGDKNVKEKLLAEVRNSSKYKREFEAGYDVNDTMDLFKLALKMDVIAVYKDLYVFNCNGVKGVSTDKEKHKGCNQFGYGFITKKEVDDLFGLKKISKKAKLMLEDKIDFELNELNSYLMGEVYGFKVCHNDGEVIDSCEGFFSIDFDKNGFKETLDEKYHHLIPVALEKLLKGNT